MGLPWVAAAACLSMVSDASTSGAPCSSSPCWSRLLAARKEAMAAVLSGAALGQEEVLRQLCATERRAAAAHRHLDAAATAPDAWLRGLEGVDAAVQQLCEHALRLQQQLRQLHRALDD